MEEEEQAAAWQLLFRQFPLVKENDIFLEFNKTELSLLIQNLAILWMLNSYIKKLEQWEFYLTTSP